MASPVNKFSATKLLAALQALDASALVSVIPTSAGAGSAIECVVPIHGRHFTGRGCSLTAFKIGPWPGIPWMNFARSERAHQTCSYPAPGGSLALTADGKSATAG